MLSTEEIKEHVYSQFSKTKNIETTDDHNIYTKFCLGKANSPEGTYVYTLDKQYHYMCTERGTILSDRMTSDLNELTYWILDYEIFLVSSKYKLQNRIEGEDSRRQLFNKILELHRTISADFYQRKKKEIEEILVEYPYNDNKDFN